MRKTVRRIAATAVASGIVAAGAVGVPDDPHGIGTTTINGVNDFGQLVGFYTDAAGNTDGVLATPQR